MRTVLTPIGSAGDHLPMFALGVELKQRGHDVCVLCTAPFDAWAQSLGLATVTLGTAAEYEQNVRQPDTFHPRKGFAVVMRMVREYLRRLGAALPEHAPAGRSLVVASPLDFVSRCRQELGQTPMVSVALAPVLFRTLHQTPMVSASLDVSGWPRWLKRGLWWLVDRGMLGPHVAPVLNDEVRRPLGLPPVSRPFAGWMHSPLLTLGLFPDWFASPQPDWPTSLRLTGFPLFDRDRQTSELPPPVTAFLDAGDPPVVFTAGSAMRHGQAFFAAAADACQRLSRRGLLLTGHAEQLPRSLPAGVSVASYAPLSRLLPRAAALVHHGGIGTSAAGLAAGVPQVVMPLSHDQPDNAARLRRLGVAKMLPPARFTGTNLTHALQDLLGDDRAQRAARAWASRCDGPGALRQSADLIEAAARSAGLA